MFSKEQKLFIVLAGIFLTNALIAEIIGGKIFSLEHTFGLEPANLTLFGQSGLGFNLTAGVLMWPVVFIMTDIINEYFGRNGVRFLSWMAAGLILYAFVMLWATMQVSPADFWKMAELDGTMINRSNAFNLVLNQGLWIIAGSLTAFLIGQFVDVYVFHWIRRKTGPGSIWLRATGSTLVSQLIDSFVVLFIAFYLSGQMSMTLVLAIGVMNYMYKSVMALALTPVLYVVHNVIDNYLGKEKAEAMMEAANKQ
jgi:queuosine precursor transporter